MIQMRPTVRYILLGRDNAIGARIGCGNTAIASLGLLALSLHALDLLTGIRMIEVYGLAAEQNPFARMLFRAVGPLGLALAKFGVVGCGVFVLVLLGLVGRRRLARNSLVLAVLLGLLGFASNLI